MSGGVDSSTAAALLKEEGHEVIGAFMDLWDCSMKDPMPSSSCCSAVNRTDAKRVASLLGIPLHILDMEEIFRNEIIDPFVDQYMAGLTPNPCIRCNERLKFHHLMKKAESIGANIVATGHYARITYEEDNGRPQLLKGIDPNKDQSYFLFPLTRDHMTKVLFPIGSYRKERVREMARNLGLPVSEKEESQEICFVPEGDYRTFIEYYLSPSARKGGEIIDEEGKILGHHEGIHAFTVGQRRGIGIPSSHPLYVLEIDPLTHRVVVGPAQSLYHSRLIAGDLNWIAIDPPRDPIEVMVRIRYRHKEAEAVASPLPDGRVMVSFQNPQRAIAPGQAAVFYKGEMVLGGGWIEKGFKS